MLKVLKMLSVENVTTKGNEHSPGKESPVLHVRLYRKGLNGWFVDMVVVGCGCGYGCGCGCGWLWLVVVVVVVGFRWGGAW